MLANHPLKQTVEGGFGKLFDVTCGRSIDKQKQDKLTNTIAKWIATNCRLISVVEDVSLRNVITQPLRFTRNILYSV